MNTHTDLHRLMDWTQIEFGIRPLDIRKEPLDLRLAVLLKCDVEGWENLATEINRTLTATQSDGLAYHAQATRASSEDMLAEAVTVVKRRLAR